MQRHQTIIGNQIRRTYLKRYKKKFKNLHVWFLKATQEGFAPGGTAEDTQVGAGDPHRHYASVHSFQLVKDCSCANPLQERHMSKLVLQSYYCSYSKYFKGTELPNKLILGSPLGHLHDKLQRRKQGCQVLVVYLRRYAVVPDSQTPEYAEPVYDTGCATNR